MRRDSRDGGDGKDGKDGGDGEMEGMVRTVGWLRWLGKKPQKNVKREGIQSRSLDAEWWPLAAKNWDVGVCIIGCPLGVGSWLIDHWSHTMGGHPQATSGRVLKCT